MFLLILGVCTCIYVFFYIFALFIFDCDVVLGLATKFGKPISSLKNKVVFITGASSGIGEHIAVALAAHGVKLVLTARREEELNRVKSKCIEVSNGQLKWKDILIICMDILDMELHEKHFTDAIEYFGKVDILVNNAGRSQRATWENTESQVDHQMFSLNVHAPINLTRIAVKYFIMRGEGHVAMTSSLSGLLGVHSGTYTATKHAVQGFYNSLRCEKATLRTLTVTLFCPGPVYTNALTESFTEKLNQNVDNCIRPSNKGISGERCGYLCAVALANKLNEVWMAKFPLIPATYTAVYYPNVYKIISKFIHPKTIYGLSPQVVSNKR